MSYVLMKDKKYAIDIEVFTRDLDIVATYEICELIFASKFETEKEANEAFNLLADKTGITIENYEDAEKLINKKGD